MTSFTIIIPTRNRPALFREALDSVLAQQDATLAVIVVNDGSDPAHLDAYRAIEAEADPRIRFVALPRRPNGHGQSYALNAGVQLADSDYVGFLDDDDRWTDPGHLRRAAAAIAAAIPATVDLYMADQTAFSGDAPMPGPVWIEDLLSRAPMPAGPDESGCYAPTAAMLLRAHGFCHLNALLVRRALFLEIGGLDEGLRYECDREFYLRAVDRAETIRYAPVSVSRHNVPVPGNASNMSTIVSRVEKRLCQLRLLDKVMLSARRPEVRSHAVRFKVYALQHLAHELAAARRLGPAAQYARQALAIRPSLGRLALTVALTARAAMAGDERR